MAVVIRLQGLRITAGSEDIRGFFTGLKIPDGGVHIIGGELEEAFVIFASDEDARRAMTRSGGCIKGSPVNLLLSSKSEMQSLLVASTKQPDMSKRRMFKEDFRRPETEATPAFSESLSVELRRTDHVDMGSRSGPVGYSEPRKQIQKSVPNNRDGLYMHLQGMPFSVLKEDVRHFFRGLEVDDIVFLKNHRGRNNGSGIVRFRSVQDAIESQKRHKEYIGTRFVEIRPSSEKQWLESGGSILPPRGNGEFHREQPLACAPWKYTQGRTRSRSPVTFKSRSPSPANEEFCVLVENLSYSVEKKDVKALFHPILLKDDQILHLHDKHGKKTRSMFVLFKSLEDYCSGLNHHKEEFLHRIVYVSPISKDKMVSMLESVEDKLDDFTERPSRSLEKHPRPQRNLFESERICLYVRNLPFDVRKVEIVDFFHGFRISEDSVVLLHDDKGAGLGEALVIFQSEDEATRAQSLNGQRFLGSEVMLKCISRSQMRELGIVDHPVMELPMERSSDRYPARESVASHLVLDRKYLDFRINPADHVPLNDLPGRSHGNSSHLDSHMDSQEAFDERGSGAGPRGFGPTSQQFNGPTCLKLINLPLQITIDEIYDFCYGYRVIPGSVSLQYSKSGVPKGSATVVFETRQEAATAVQELSGRPIGTKNIKIVYV